MAQVWSDWSTLVAVPIFVASILLGIRRLLVVLLDE